MYGADIATLNVIINGNNVFTASGNKGNKWLRAAIDVSLSGKHAVRDIIIRFGGCFVYSNCNDFASSFMVLEVSDSTWCFFFVFENNTFKKFTVRFRAVRKEIVSSMYNNMNYCHFINSHAIRYPSQINDCDILLTLIGYWRAIV